MLLHTTDTIPGQTIQKSLGMVETVIWLSPKYKNNFREVAREYLINQAKNLGANAIVGVQVSVSGPAMNNSGHMNRMYVLSGTAVVI